MIPTFTLEIIHADHENEFHTHQTANDLCEKIPSVLHQIALDYELNSLKVCFDLVIYKIERE